MTELIQVKLIPMEEEDRNQKESYPDRRLKNAWIEKVQKYTVLFCRKRR